MHKYHEEHLRKLHTTYSWKITANDILKKPEEIVGTTLKAYHGVSLAWRQSIAHQVEEMKVTSTRFVPVKFRPKEDQEVILISVYLPTGTKLTEFKETLDKLSLFLLDISIVTPVIIGGDINISTKSTRQKLLVWNAFLEEHSLLELKPPDVTYHHRPNFGETKSILDYFVIRAAGIVTEMSCVNVTDEDLLEANRSDHTPILGQFKILHATEGRSEMEELYEKIKIPSHSWDLTKLAKYDIEVRKEFQRIDNQFMGDGWAENKLELYSIALGECAERVMGPKIIRSRRCLLPKRMKVLYKELRRRKRRLATARRKSEDRSEIQLLVSHVKSIKAAINVRDQQWEAKASEKLIRKLHSPQEYFKHMRRTRQAKQSPIPAKMTTCVGTFYGGDVLNGLAENFEEAGKFSQSENFDEETKCRVHYLLDIVTKLTENSEKTIPNIGVEKMDYIISKMGTDKACDIYGCRPRYLKALRSETRKHFTISVIAQIIHEVPGFLVLSPQAVS